MINLRTLRGQIVHGLTCTGCRLKAHGTEPKSGRWIAYCLRCRTAQQVGGPDHGKMLEVELG